MSGLKINLDSIKNNTVSKKETETKDELPLDDIVKSETPKNKEKVKELEVEETIILEEEKEEPKVEEKSATEKQDKKSPVKSTKINLSGIKSLDDTDEKEEKLEDKPKEAPDEKKVETENTKEKETIEQKTENVSSLIKEESSDNSEKHNEKPPITSSKINLSGIKSIDSIDKERKKVDDKQEAEKKEKDDIKKQKENEVPDKEIFVKYKSDFEKNKTSVLEKIKKLKNLPKTRTAFLATIVLITLLGIIGLFKIDPETHSIDNYKTSILAVFNKDTKVKPTDNNNDPVNTIDIIDTNTGEINTSSGDIETSTGEIIANTGTDTKFEETKKSGFDIKYETQIVEGQEVIIYDGTTYASNDEFEEKLEKVVNKLKKEKLSDFFRK